MNHQHLKFENGMLSYFTGIHRVKDRHMRTRYFGNPSHLDHLRSMFTTYLHSDMIAHSELSRQLPYPQVLDEILRREMDICLISCQPNYFPNTPWNVPLRTLMRSSKITFMDSIWLQVLTSIAGSNALQPRKLPSSFPVGIALNSSQMYISLFERIR